MIRVFFDTSVLFAAAYSSTGSARDLVRLAIEQKIIAVVSQDVLNETERNIQKKVPQLLTAYQEFLVAFDPQIVPSPPAETTQAAEAYTVAKDAPIIAAAQLAKPDYFVTYDQKHLLNVPGVATRSGLIITTPDVVVRTIQDELNNKPEMD